jgi:hypothetical protein
MIGQCIAPLTAVTPSGDSYSYCDQNLVVGLTIHSDSLQNSSVVPIAEHFVALDCMHADDVGASFCHAMRNLQILCEA